MRFVRADYLQALLAGGMIASIIIPLIILIFLWFWARGAVASMFETFLPENMAKNATNIAFGLLALYFLVKFLSRR